MYHALQSPVIIKLIDLLIDWHLLKSIYTTFMHVTTFVLLDPLINDLIYICNIMVLE